MKHHISFFLFQSHNVRLTTSLSGLLLQLPNGQVESVCAAVDTHTQGDRTSSQWRVNGWESSSFRTADAHTHLPVRGKRLFSLYPNRTHRGCFQYTLKKKPIDYTLMEFPLLHIILTKSVLFVTLPASVVNKHLFKGTIQVGDGQSFSATSSVVVPLSNLTCHPLSHTLACCPWFHGSLRVCHASRRAGRQADHAAWTQSAVVPALA